METILSGMMYMIDSLSLRPILTGMFALGAAIYFLARLFENR